MRGISGPLQIPSYMAESQDTCLSLNCDPVIHMQAGCDFSLSSTTECPEPWSSGKIPLLLISSDVLTVDHHNIWIFRNLISFLIESQGTIGQRGSSKGSFQSSLDIRITCTEFSNSSPESYHPDVNSIVWIMYI